MKHKHAFLILQPFSVICAQDAFKTKHAIQHLPVFEMICIFFFSYTYLKSHF